MSNQTSEIQIDLNNSTWDANQPRPSERQSPPRDASPSETQSESHKSDNPKPENGTESQPSRKRSLSQGDRHYVRPPKKYRPKPGAIIWIGNLTPTTTEDQLVEIFGPIGEIKEIRIKKQQEAGYVKGFAFIEFATAELAAKAIELGTPELNGRQMKIELSNASSRQREQSKKSKNSDLNPPKEIQESRIHEPQRHPPEGCRTVFIGNLSDAVEDDTIFEVFSGVGDIKAIRWVNDRNTGKFKGCGFVEFYTEQAAVSAAAKNGTAVLGRPMRVDYASNQNDDSKSKKRDEEDRSRGRRDDSNDRDDDLKLNLNNSRQQQVVASLYIGNLPDTIDDETIHALFGSYGKIHRIRWLSDKTLNKFKGSGFIDFSEDRGIASALNLNGTIIHGKAIKVNFGTKSNTLMAGNQSLNQINLAQLSSLAQNLGGISNINLGNLAMNPYLADRNLAGALAARNTTAALNPLSINSTLASLASRVNLNALVNSNALVNPNFNGTVPVNPLGLNLGALGSLGLGLGFPAANLAALNAAGYGGYVFGGDPSLVNPSVLNAYNQSNRQNSGSIPSSTNTSNSETSNTSANSNSSTGFGNF